jgi:raffinose/stachyose/melibiose transport system substrate-binding protein
MLSKRLFLWIIGLVIVITLVAACGSAAQPAAPVQATQEPTTASQPVQATEEPVSAAQPAAPEEVINLTMWDIPESDPYTAWWNDYIAKFNAAHPNIQVKLEVFPGDAYKPKWAAALTADTLPDIWYGVLGPETEAAYKDGKVKSLEGLLKKERWSDVSVRGCSIEGKMVCMPLYTAPEYVYYNKKLFAQAGVDPQKWANPQQPTWDEFTAAAEALKKAGIPPIALGNKDNWPGIQWMWAFESRFGGNEAFYAAVSGEGAYNSPPMLKAAEYTQMLAQNEWLTPGFNGIGGDDKYTLWTQGHGAMIFQGPWLLGYVQSAPEDFDYSFFIFPSFPEQDPKFQGLIMAGIDALWISAKSPHPEAAAEFLNGFSEPDVAVDFAIKTQNVSAIKGVKPPAGHENDTVWQLGEVASTATGFSPWWDIAGLPPAVNDEMLNMSQGLFAQEITPQEFVDRLEKAAGR